MSFQFRGENLDLTFYCVNVQDGEMDSTGERYNFHSTTKDCFDTEYGQDLCHRYSFSSMKDFLCYSYNTGNYAILDSLIDVMYSYGENPYPDDYNDAAAVIEKIRGKADMVRHYNELLYILNNVIINLRPGNLSWNRSIQECYDPGDWYADSNGFVITDSTDVYLLDNLLKIYVDPSTIFFYTAAEPEGKRFLYSSNNDFPNAGAKVYKECDDHVFIKFEDGTVKQIT